MKDKTINQLFIETLQNQLNQFKAVQYDKYNYPVCKEKLTFEEFIEFILAKKTDY